MKVKELIAKLNELPPDAECVIEIEDYDSCHTCDELSDIYETSIGTICIKGLNI